MHWIKINSINWKNSTTVAILKNALEEGTTMLTNWLRTDAMTQVNSLMSNLTVGIFNAIGKVFNSMLIGVIVSVYILYSKEICTTSNRKRFMHCSVQVVPIWFLHITTKSNRNLRRICDRQDSGFSNYRSIVLYWPDNSEYAIYNVGKCDCRSDKCNSVFGPIYQTIPVRY